MPLRQAIAPPMTVTGRLVSGDTVEPEPDLHGLRRTATALASSYYSDDYAALAGLLPALVRSARTAVDHFDGGPQHTEALRIRADVLQMAGRYLTQVRASRSRPHRPARRGDGRCRGRGRPYGGGVSGLPAGLDADPAGAPGRDRAARHRHRRRHRAAYLPCDPRGAGGLGTATGPRVVRGRARTTARTRHGRCCVWRVPRARPSAAARPRTHTAGASSTGPPSHSRRSRTTPWAAGPTACSACRPGSLPRPSP